MASGLPTTAIATYTLDDYGIPLSAPITSLGPSSCSPVNSLGDYGTTRLLTLSSYNEDSSLAQYDSSCRAIAIGYNGNYHEFSHSVQISEIQSFF